MMPRRGTLPPLALFRAFARNLPMARAMLTWGGYELGRMLSVDLHDRELVIVRVCARCGCGYEWGVHAAGFGERAALDRAALAATVLGDEGDQAWSSRDRLLVALVDRLHEHATVADALWQRLRRHWTEEQLLDLLMLAGWYHAICYVANVAALPPEPWAIPYPAAPSAGTPQ
ncbi:MAG: carboxymuconolactone decarboxylase family protein [Streptosporangiales bacterium]|nr:carboxymuconolactone decarboxylase family protein [Streptosporangiales bacterium]